MDECALYAFEFLKFVLFVNFYVRFSNCIQGNDLSQCPCTIHVGVLCATHIHSDTALIPPSLSPALSIAVHLSMLGLRLSCFCHISPLIVFPLLPTFLYLLYPTLMDVFIPVCNASTAPKYGQKIFHSSSGSHLLIPFSFCKRFTKWGQFCIIHN